MCGRERVQMGRFYGGRRGAVDCRCRACGRAHSRPRRSRCSTLGFFNLSRRDPRPRRLQARLLFFGVKFEPQGRQILGESVGSVVLGAVQFATIHGKRRKDMLAQGKTDKSRGRGGRHRRRCCVGRRHWRTGKAVFSHVAVDVAQRFASGCHGFRKGRVAETRRCRIGRKKITPPTKKSTGLLWLLRRRL